MAPLTSRGKAVAGLALLLSATLCAGAAVAFVKASDHDETGGRTLPRPQPTLSIASATPAPTASPTASPTPSPVTTTAAPSPSPAATTAPSPTVSPTSSPRPRATTSPRPEPPAGLALSATLDPAEGYIFPGTVITMKAHATDGAGKITLLSLDWGDGTVITNQSGKACSAPARGDCRDFTLQHSYDRPGDYEIELRVTSTDPARDESQTLTFPITINECNGPCESPTPTSGG